jgi:hypothetical protein
MVSVRNVADPESACKPMRPGPAAGSERAPGALERFAKLVGDGAVLMTTAQFGRSPVRQAAYRLRARCPDLDFKLSWRVFATLADWGKRWAAEQDTFAAGLILSAAGDPAVDRAAGRCLADLARLGRPLLWGVVGPGVRWRSRFILIPNGWPPEEIGPSPFAYARLGMANDTPEFRPRFDPVLYSAEPDFSVSIPGSNLRWWEARHFHWETLDGKRVLFFGRNPNG